MQNKIGREKNVLYDLVDIQTNDIPKYSTDGSAGIDLFVREETEIPANIYFKQTENIMKVMAEKLMGLISAEGSLAPEKVRKDSSDMRQILKQISMLNSQYNKNQAVKVPLNIRVAYPGGHLGLLIPRSSIIKRGLIQANGIGLIDTDFVNEHLWPVINLTNSPIILQAGEKVAQLVILPFPKIRLSRGSVEVHGNHDGFGSTTKK